MSPDIFVSSISNGQHLCTISCLTLTLLLLLVRFESQHDKTSNMTCAPSDDSDQPGHSPSLTRLFAVRTKLSTHKAHGEDSDQTGQMPRLIRVFAGRTGHYISCRVAAHFAEFRQVGTLGQLH